MLSSYLLLYRSLYWSVECLFEDALPCLFKLYSMLLLLFVFAVCACELGTRVGQWLDSVFLTFLRQAILAPRLNSVYFSTTLFEISEPEMSPDATSTMFGRRKRVKNGGVRERFKKKKNICPLALPSILLAITTLERGQLQAHVALQRTYRETCLFGGIETCLDEVIVSSRCSSTLQT